VAGDEEAEVVGGRFRVDPADDVVEVEEQLGVLLILAEGDRVDSGVVPAHRVEVAVRPDGLLERFVAHRQRGG
jgi:hypothetical protein